MIVIVDYGAGNLKSIYNILVKVGAKCKISDQGSDIRNADKLILPGVGHYGHGMQKLTSMHLTDDLNWFAHEAKRPLLGICLGAQMLGTGSDEAPGIAGLGWLNMHCRRLPALPGLRVPNMGWHEIECREEIPVIGKLEPESRFYFLHSYYMDCEDVGDIAAYTTYGIRFASIVCMDNITGIQFHPEKSHRYGMNIMRNFNLI